MKVTIPEVRDLGLIGDQRTAAVISRSGSILWYCPGRFDGASLLAGLLDSDKGGAWVVQSPDVRVRSRRYWEDSAILETSLCVNDEDFAVTDWMPAGDSVPQGICRHFSAAPEDITIALSPAPNYARDTVELKEGEDCVEVNGRCWLYGSHPLVVRNDTIRMVVPKGEEGWSVLLEHPYERPTQPTLRVWLDLTLSYWRSVASRIKYHGPYTQEVADSLRALRLLSYAPNGGIIAAATTSLPEAPGGQRNYDYRYVWLRDAGMIVSALVRAGSVGLDERMFLAFVCGSKQIDPHLPLLPPFTSLDQAPAPDIRELDFAGYGGARPVQIGNGANNQLQLDGFGNVLLAAKLIYGKTDTREHWETIEQIAEFIVENWHKPDHGIWEESRRAQYTVGKVVCSCGLDYISQYAEDASQAERWRCAAKDIRDYVHSYCINSEGAYSAIAGEEAVDVSAVLFPTWGFVKADAPEVKATLRVLERDYSEVNLYWRHLESFDSRKEGAFLAGTTWVAQYWIMCDDLERAKAILDAVLAYSNDLGLFAEEANPETGQMQGNIPQAFVHAAFIGAAIDYCDANAQRGSR